MSACGIRMAGCVASPEDALTDLTSIIGYRGGIEISDSDTIQSSIDFLEWFYRMVLQPSDRDFLE